MARLRCSCPSQRWSSSLPARQTLARLIFAWVTYRIDMKRVIMRKLVMGIGDASMEVDGREIYSARDLRVGLFTSTDDF